jgi:hypothetical protein
VRNVGKGVAINVSMMTVEIGEDTMVEHLGLMHLRPGEAGSPRLRVVSRKFGPVPPLEGTTAQQQAVQVVTTRNPVVSLDYESNVRGRYRTSFVLEGTTVRLQDDGKR